MSPLTNAVLNPSAEGGTASLVAQSNGSVSMVADAATGAGARSYRTVSTAATTSSFGLRPAERPAATAGQRWHFRTRARLDTGVIGARQFRCGVVFRDASGAGLAYAPGQVDVSPVGVFHRWLGTADASRSERIEGTSRRSNEILDPRFTNTNAWYKNPKATYDFSQPGGVAISVSTSALVNGDLVTYPASATAPNEFGTPKAASYKIVNTGSAAFTIYGNTRAYGAAISLDGPISSDYLVGPGETVIVQLPAVTPTADQAQGYRALIRVRGTVAVGQSMIVAEHIAEAVPTASDTTGPFFSGASSNTGTGNTQQVVDLTATAVAPSGTATADFTVSRVNTVQAAAGDVVFFDALMLAQRDQVETPAYGDGSLEGWYWNGAAHASTSSYGRGAPILTADAGEFSVALRFDSVLPATQTMTVTAVTPELTYPVRSADRVFAVGGLAVTDYEAPPGVDVSYLGHMFAADGTDLGYTDTASARYEIDPSMVIVSDPLDPAKCVLVEAQEDFGGVKVRKRVGSTYRVGNRTIGLYAPLGLYEGLDLSIQTKSLADADTLEQILEAMPVLVRSMPPVRVPRQLYVAIEATEAEDVDVQYGGEWTRYPMKGAQVSRAVTDIVIPVVTWQTYMDVYPTWSLFNAAYASWLDAIENPPEVVLART